MHPLKTLASAAAMLILISACGGGASSERQKERKVGGCEIDTVSLGLSGGDREAAGKSDVRVSILSVRRAPEATWIEAHHAVSGLVDSLGGKVVWSGELTIVREGPCWPRCRIDMLVTGLGDGAAPLREALLETPIGGASPSVERPEGYGLLFVQAGRGSSDIWTVWYSNDRRP